MEPTNTWEILIRRVIGGYIITRTSFEDPEFIYEMVVDSNDDPTAILKEIADYFDIRDIHIEAKPIE